MKQYSFWRNILHLHAPAFLRDNTPIFVLSATKCFTTTHLLEKGIASRETSSSRCIVRVAQCNIKLTSPLVERAISQDDEQSQVRGTPPKVIGRKRVQETNQCTAAHAYGAPRFRRRHRCTALIA